MCTATSSKNFWDKKHLWQHRIPCVKRVKSSAPPPFDRQGWTSGPSARWESPMTASSAKGAAYESPGQRPGNNARPICQGQKGRNICSAKVTQQPWSSARLPFGCQIYANGGLGLSLVWGAGGSFAGKSDVINRRYSSIVRDPLVFSDACASVADQNQASGRARALFPVTLKMGHYKHDPMATSKTSMRFTGLWQSAKHKKSVVCCQTTLFC